jgi:acetyl esterase
MTDPAHAYDPELMEIVALIPTGDFGDLTTARAGLESMLPMINAGLDETGLTIVDRIIAGPADHPELTVRTYVPGDRMSDAGILYLHGGGYILGSIESEHAGAAKVAREVGVVVISVEYRLAPEDPFPAGLEDCYAALCWLGGPAQDLDVDTERIAVMGTSAGGGLAAALALLTRARGGPQPCFQFLGCPEIDDRMQTPSMTAFTDTPMFNRPAAEASWNHYLGADRQEVSPYAAPSRATDLTGLPPAYVSTQEFDPLRDEGIEYFRALQAAGVSCELHSFPGTFHGSAVVTSAEVSRREQAEMIAVLRRRLG